MNKHVLALSTALSILVFTPAFAQNNTTTGTTGAGGIDCTQEANKNDPACTGTQNNNAAGQTQTQTGSGSTAASGTAGSTTDQNAASGTSGAAGSSGSTMDQNAASGTAGSTAAGTGTQMGASELIVPADRLNNAQVMSANDYIGKTVYDQAGNNIGDVNDLIIANNGEVQAVILGVGGFLGIGEKDVAVNTQAVQMVQDGDNTRLVVQTTKEALNNAPSYDRTNRRYANGMSTGTTDSTGSTTAPVTGSGTNADGTTGTGMSGSGSTTGTGTGTGTGTDTQQ